MERRNFIKGLLIGASAVAGELIVKASPAEVSAFGKPDQVVIGALGPVADKQTSDWLLGQRFISEDGRTVLLPMEMTISVDTEAIDVTAGYDVYYRFRPGLNHVGFRMSGYVLQHSSNLPNG